jgi:hypothetical protein
MKPRLVGSIVVLMVVGAIAGYLATRDQGKRRAVPWQDITSEVSRHPEWAQPTISIIRDREKLVKIFRVATLEEQPPPPPVDFGKRQAILIAVGPRSSTGYSLRVERITENDERVDIVVRERTPGLREHVTPRLTFPYRLITIPRSTKRVHVRYAARS